MSRYEEFSVLNPTIGEKPAQSCVSNTFLLPFDVARDLSSADRTGHWLAWCSFR